MNDEDDPRTITVGCRVKGCGYIKSYLPENPSDLLPVLQREVGGLPSEAARACGSALDIIKIKKNDYRN